MERWDHDTERDDFYQEEVERKMEEVARAKTRKFGIMGSILLMLHFYLNRRLANGIFSEWYCRKFRM